MKMSLSMRKRLKQLPIHVFLIAATLLTLIPFLWMLSASVKPNDQVFDGGLWFFPNSFSLEGYLQVFDQTPFFRWAYNTLFVAFVSTLGQVAIAFITAFAFVHFRFPGRNALFYFTLATMIIPMQAVTIPTFITVNMLHWINTFTGVIVPYLANGYAIFLMRQFFLSVPKELSDAASIDGCGPFRVLRHIYLPTAIPAMTALGIILFVNHWNEFYWPLLILQDRMNMTLPVALLQFRLEDYIYIVPTMAVATLSTLPVLILYMISQKQFVEGLTHSGLKG